MNSFGLNVLLSDKLAVIAVYTICSYFVQPNT